MTKPYKQKTGDSDEKLMFRFTENAERDALDRLYRRYFGDLVKYLYWLGAKKEEAEDIVQSCFLKFLEQAPDYDHQRSFKVWIFVVLKNRWLNDQRGIARRKANEADFEAAEIIDESMVREDSNARKLALVQKAIEYLPKEQAEIIALKYSSNFSLDEIKDIQNIPIGTVKSRLFNAVKKLGKLTKQVNTINSRS